MSRPRFISRSVLTNPNHGQVLRTLLMQGLTGLGVREVMRDNPNGAEHILDVTFDTPADANAYLLWCETGPTHVAIHGKVSAHTMSTHDCTHWDAVVADCRTTNYIEHADGG